MRNERLTDDAMLLVDGLSIETCVRGTPATTLVNRVSFHVPAGQVTALVGESGSGKTLTALAIMGLLPESELRVRESSRIYFRGRELLGTTPSEFVRLRGTQMAMVFQDPGSSLNPVLTVGAQIEQPLRRHFGMSRRLARARAVELLSEVGIPSPHTRIEAFPHELSGGQQQRVMIAMAIACGPKLLIADEPTSALDTTVQRQILELFGRLRRDHELTMLVITHDLGIVRYIADRVIVFRNGLVREEGDTKKILVAPTDQYTRALIASRRLLEAPRDRRRRSADTGQSGSEWHAAENARKADHLLEVRGLIKRFPVRGLFQRKAGFTAVNNISFTLDKRETLGIMGESGSGKTTVAMAITRLIQPTSGEVRLHGKEILTLSTREFRRLRRRVQLVFQNPFASLNPRRPIRRALLSPMELHHLGRDARDREDRAVQLLEKVGLLASALDKFPHQFSGGERQRIVIARALAAEPDILICDEAVSALDVTVQLQILELLSSLQRELGIAYIFISHDLTAIRYMADRVLVMRGGESVEEGDAVSILDAPKHPYTAQLLAAESRLDERL